MKEILKIPHGPEYLTLTFFFSSLLLAPVLEELAFRHPLKDLQFNYLISIGAIVILIGISLFNKKSVGFFLLILGLIYTILWMLQQKGRIQARTSSKAIYVLSMSFFVIAHFAAVETFQLIHWPIYTLYGVHMAVCAYFLSKIRLQKDTCHSIVLHFLYNLLPALFLIF